MRIIKVLLVLAFCVAVLGFYRGWFSLSSRGRDADSNKVNVSLTVDTDRIKDDAGKVKDKATALAGNGAAEAKEPGDQAQDKVKSDDE
jgi:hypothetical protein